jgi:hypothetical protein
MAFLDQSIITDSERIRIFRGQARFSGPNEVSADGRVFCATFSRRHRSFTSDAGYSSKMTDWPSKGRPQGTRFTGEHESMSQSVRFQVPVLFVIVAAVAMCPRLAGAHEVTPSIVIRWNQAALQAVRDSTLGPPMVARALAIVHTCIYDAWAAYDKNALGTQWGGGLRQHPFQHKIDNKKNHQFCCLPRLGGPVPG